MATLERLESHQKRDEIIRMRFAGHTLQQVGDKLGMTLQGVKYHEDAWLAEQKPSAEQTEDRRQKQLAGIDSIRAKLFAAVDGADVTPAEWLAVVDRLDKLWAREAKLMGLDMQQSQVTLAVTAEGLAAAFGYDDVVDVEPVAIEAAPSAEEDGE